MSTSFSKYDLYSKSKVRVDVEKVKPYYLSLIEKVNAAIEHRQANYSSSLLPPASFLDFFLTQIMLLQYFPAKLKWYLLQTAEAIRKDYPTEDWLHLTGLIHGIFLS